MPIGAQERRNMALFANYCAAYRSAVNRHEQRAAPAGAGHASLAERCLARLYHGAKPGVFGELREPMGRGSAAIAAGEGAEGGYLRLSPQPRGGDPRLRRKKEMPDPDGLIVQLNYVRA
jgi:hypothetical protein